MPEPPKRIVITRDEPQAEGDATSGFAARHPDLAYVFGPTVRGLYAVGCLALDLLGPLEVLQLLPGQEPIAIPVLFLAFAGLAYLEYRAYRLLWPRGHGPKVVDMAGQRRV